MFSNTSCCIQAGYSRCTEGREGVGLGRPGREAYMQVYKNKFWDKFSKKPNNKFIHVDLHVGFPARAAQADSFSAARTPRVSCLNNGFGGLRFW